MTQDVLTESIPVAAPAEPSDLARIAARGQAYLLFAQALEYPDDALLQRIASGQLATELNDVLLQVDASLATNVVALMDCGSDEDELQVEYTRLFDTAAAKDACHLYESGYVGSKDRALEESLRFYDYFGLALSEAAREMPDYLVTQLEFLHYLAYCQAAVASEGGDPQPYRLAERDFIERHPSLWVPKLNRQLQEKQPMPYFGALMASLCDLLETSARQLDIDERAEDN